MILNETDIFTLEQRLQEHILPQFSQALIEDEEINGLFIPFPDFYILLNQNGIQCGTSNYAIDTNTPLNNLSVIHNEDYYNMCSYDSFQKGSLYVQRSSTSNYYSPFSYSNSELMLIIAEKIFEYMENRPQARLEKAIQKSELYFPKVKRELMVEANY